MYCPSRTSWEGFLLSQWVTLVLFSTACDTHLKEPMLTARLCRWWLSALVCQFMGSGLVARDLKNITVIKFNRLSAVIYIWFQEISPHSGDFNRHMVAEHSDTVAPPTHTQWLRHCPDASAFHYLLDVASWMSTLALGKFTLTRRIQPALATSSNSANIPLIQ